MQPKVRGKLLVRLNMTPRPIANKYSDGNLKRTFVFDTTTLYVKDTGVFYAPDQPLYQYSFADNEFAEEEDDDILTAGGYHD